MNVHVSCPCFMFMFHVHVHVGHACGQDETGKVIELCNDGNVYCGITTFDWTQPKVRELWMRAVQNATETGQLILLPSPGVSNEGGSSELFPPLPAVSWGWVPAWGSLEPPQRDVENAQKMRKNGEKMAEIRSKTCEQGKEGSTGIRTIIAGIWVVHASKSASSRVMIVGAGHVDGIFADHSGTCERRRSGCRAALVES